MKLPNGQFLNSQNEKKNYASLLLIHRGRNRGYTEDNISLLLLLYYVGLGKSAHRQIGTNLPQGSEVPISPTSKNIKYVYPFQIKLKTTQDPSKTAPPGLGDGHHPYQVNFLTPVVTRAKL